MSKTFKTFTSLAVVAGWLFLVVSMAHAGPFGPLTPQEVGNVCTRCESIITKNLPAAGSIVYIKKSAEYPVKCSEFDGNIQYCESVGGPAPKVNCDEGDVSVAESPDTAVVMWKGKKVVKSQIFLPGYNTDSPVQETTATSVNVCANTTP